MQSQGNANHFISIGLNFGVLIACIGPTWIVLSALDRNHEGDNISEAGKTGDIAREEDSQKGRDIA